MAGPVVTISRQYGSGGEAVAARVAERLGVQLLDREIRQRAAARSGVSERTLEEAQRPQSFVTRMLERLGSVGIMADGAAVETAAPLAVPTSEGFRAVMDEVVREAAEAGAVIIGHAAHLALRDQPGVLRVFVQAPIEARIARVCHEEHLSPDEARRRIEGQDRERVRFYNDTYHVNWYDSRLYDCVVDTHLLGLHGAADMVVTMAERVCVALPEPLPALEAISIQRAEAATPIAPDPGQVVTMHDEAVRIRPMGSGDAPRLLGFFRDLPPQDLLFLRRDVTNSFVADEWERDVIDGRMITLLGENIPEDGSAPSVIGEASLRRSEVPWTSHVGEVRVVVSEGYRSKGLGATLLKELLRAADAAGIEKVTADMIAEQTGARRLFSSLGFIEEGHYSGHARDQAGHPHDLVVMTYNSRSSVGAH